MRAIVLRETGGPEQLRVETAPDPVASEGEIVVRLRAAALNHRDVWIRTGKYAGIRLPVILGSDGAGVVESAGSGVPEGIVGTSVLLNPSLDWGTDPAVQGKSYRILGLPDDGTYAERVRVPFRNAVAMPAGWSFEEAAALPLAALTAYRAVVTRGGLREGETVLVTGIGGGVALFALQIARSLGARVFVTSASDEKIKRALDLGAAGGVNYSREGWVQEAVRLCGERGPDLAIDGAGGETFAQLLEAVRPGGRIVNYGATTGPAKSIEVRRIFWKQLTVLGSTMGSPSEFDAMVKHFTVTGLKPVIDSVFTLDEASAAHRRMEQRTQFGKIVLNIP